MLLIILYYIIEQYRKQFKNSQIIQSIKNHMQKSSLFQQLQALKKSLKNKRQVQIWQHCIQFYRNHQSTITNYHILDLIKIAIKPIKHSILKSCKYISKLSNRYCNNNRDRIQNKRYSQQIRIKIKQQIKSLKNKIAVMQNLFDCYTLALQTILIQADSAYFKMMFRKNYHAHRSNKLLLFQPVSHNINTNTNINININANININNINNTQKQKQFNNNKNTTLQHEIACYLKFVCEISLLYCTSILVYEDENKISECFKIVDKSLKNIFESSYKFAKKQLEYQILKLNFITKCQINNNYKIIYKFPLESFYQIYKNCKKWDNKHIGHYYRLLLRYIFLIFMNINNNNIVYNLPYSLQNTNTNNNNNQNTNTHKIANNNNNINNKQKMTVFHIIQTQIYIYMKQMLILFQYINFKNIDNSKKYMLQFMSIIVDSYQQKITQMKKWSQFLCKYFNYTWIYKFIGQDKPILLDGLKQVIKQALTKRQEIKQSEISQSQLSRKTIYLDRDNLSIKNNNKNMRNKFSNLFNKIQNVFNYIEESDSDSDDQMIHQFQKIRRKNIQNFDMKNMNNNVYQQKQKDERNQELENWKIGDKLDDLKGKCQNFQRFSTSALQLLTKRKYSTHQYHKIQFAQNQPQLPQIGHIPHIFTQKPNPPLLKSIQPKTYVKQDYTSQSIPLTIKPKQQAPQKHQYRHQYMNLSNKYDKMRKTLLLTSTKQKDV